MYDKIALINLVWMLMVGTMLVTTVSLYEGREVKVAKNEVTSVTTPSYNFGQN